MAERHQVFLRRTAGEERPWTTDEILQKYPFTNVFRVYDRTTQYILRHVINQGSQDLHESCFRVILFRVFNRIDTWKYLKQQFGELTWADFDVYSYEKVLEAADGPLYSPAYFCPAPTNVGGKSHFARHLRLVQLFMEENLPRQLKRFRYLKDAHGWLRLFPSMGDFTALQLALDLNMLPHFNWSEDEWVGVGPGSKACLRKIFGPGVCSHELEALQWLHATQDEHFSRLGIPVDRRPRLCQLRRPGVTMVDLEHALCECEKYSRALHPDIKGKHTKVAKNVFVPTPKRPTADLPVNWTKTSSRPVKLTRPPPVHADGDEVEWEISRIVSERTEGPAGHYVLRWTGYGPEDDTCQPEKDLIGEAQGVLNVWKSMKGRIRQRLSEYQTLSSRELKDRKSQIVEVPDGQYLW
ncbi:uncharacterized protein B0H18DRAFT_909066 [Fomitopsis serialis]|uniref:uncharacterized protein n=1 Tax=Fomitopsis serialis TaxID=139415 RepID=UPI002007651F|nr:uncharacterized protein B0H18DRAFT_909066 [Neoantrodia serialis]KAH9924729.1 hypothetical protein B0H18DRAFT_909066 [Neoantrodia serialis]